MKGKAQQQQKKKLFEHTKMGIILSVKDYACMHDGELTWSGMYLGVIFLFHQKSC